MKIANGEGGVQVRTVVNVESVSELPPCGSKRQLLVIQQLKMKLDFPIIIHAEKKTKLLFVQLCRIVKCPNKLQSRYVFSSDRRTTGPILPIEVCFFLFIGIMMR